MKKPAKRKKANGLRSLGDGRKVGARRKRSGAKLRSLGDARPVRSQ
jgi:hypothetical protein